MSIFPSKIATFYYTYCIFLAIGVQPMKPKADPHFTRKNQCRLLDDKVRLLDEFIDLQHPLVLLAQRIDWSSFEPHWQKRFSDASGPKGASARMAAGLLLLKHMEGLSDEGLMLAWVCNPYYQYFCGETHFQHQPPINPITLGRWRKLLGDCLLYTSDAADE